MIFEKMVRIPADRVGVLIGRSGATKSSIESACGVRLGIDGESGEVLVEAASSAPQDIERIRPFKAVEIVTAIGRGFSPRHAMLLLREENALHVLDLREFGGKSRGQIERIKGRLIGEGGRARRNMENLSSTSISVYGRTVSVIGSSKNLRLAVDAISSLSAGSMHGSVYGRLESARRRERVGRMQLWEDQDVF